MHITTTINETQNRDRSYIYIPKEDQHYFPQPNEKFKIIDAKNGEQYIVHLENAFRIPGLTRFFKSHSEIKIGTKIILEIIEKYKTYKIYINHTNDHQDQPIKPDSEVNGNKDNAIDSDYLNKAIQDYNKFRKLMLEDVSEMSVEELKFIVYFDRHLKAIGKVSNEKSDNRRPVSEIYFDSEGKEVTRASTEDFQTLSSRHKKIIFDLPGFKDDKNLMEWVFRGASCYDAGEYSKAHRYFSWSLKKLPTLEPSIFYHVRICEHVLSNPLTADEIRYEESHEHYIALPKWFRFLSMPNFHIRVRCKWCRRYTEYTHPDVPTFGHDNLANSCASCGRMYPMPSWLWDSPDGRAYSYYRMSFNNDEFYQEFEKDYNPKPLCKRSQKEKPSLR